MNEKLTKMYNHLLDDFCKYSTEGPYIKLEVEQTISFDLIWCNRAKGIIQMNHFSVPDLVNRSGMAITEQ